MKKIVLFITSLVFANCPPPDLDCSYLPSSRECMLFETGAPTRDYFASFDFLWWEGIEKGLEYASKNTNTFYDQNLQIYEPDFSFEPAFRLALGYHLPLDNWDLIATYTRYYNHTLNHASHSFSGNPNGGIRAIWTSAVAFQGSNFRSLWQDARAKWKIHANFLDLILKSAFCLSSHLSIEPSFGLKLALLEQRYHVVYENGNTAEKIEDGGNIQFVRSTIAMKNRSFNLGPIFSVLTRWNMFGSFDGLGALSSSLFASRFHVARNESDLYFFNGTQYDYIREGETYWTVRPQAAGSFGFGWSHCFSKVFFGISASYEAQIFWKQNMLNRFIDETSAAMVAPTQGDLFFHGLTVDAFIDF